MPTVILSGKMKAHRTIPADFEDWLHGGAPPGVRSSLEKHPFSNTAVAFCEQCRAQLLGLDIPNRPSKPLFPAVASGNLVLPFAV